jgi:hypothetical protein
MRPLIISNLDGTIADIRHRIHLREAGDWIGFHQFACTDSYNHGLVNMLRQVDADIAICAGRPHEMHGTTERWLFDNDIPYTNLHLRSPLCFDTDEVFKFEVWRQNYQDREIWFALESNDKAAEMWRSNDIHCWQVGKLI